MKITYIPHQANYEVSLSSECSYFKEGKGTLTYDIEVKHIKTEANVFFIEVNKTNVLMNDAEAHDAFNDMLLLTGEAINKVVVRVNESGMLLGLSNFEEIKKKWLHARNMAEDMYKGHIISNYLEGMQKKFDSAEILWNALSKNLFYTAFFNGIYKNYIDSKNDEHEMIIRDLLPTQGVGVLVNQTLALDKEENDFILSMKGIEAFDGISQHTKDFFKGKTKLETLPEMCLVEVEATYNIVPSTGVINSIAMEAKVSYDDFYQKNMHIEIIKSRTKIF